MFIFLTVCGNSSIKYLDSMKNDLDTMVKIASKEDDYMTLALKQHRELVYDEYIQSRLESKFKSERDDARGNKLILKDSLYSYICPDLYAFCTWLFCGIKNPQGIIPRNYVYNSFFNDKPYDVVDCLRSPHLYVEHGIRKLVKDDVLDKCKEWFSGYDTIVSSHDMLCRLLMFDMDGDEMLLTPNKTLIDCVPDNVVPLYYVPFEASKSVINNESIYEAIVSCSENSQIGDISNVITKNYNSPDTDMEFNKIMCCYNNLAIDYPKTQNIVELGMYEEKYTALKNEKNPYIFIYAKGKRKSACKELGNSNTDRVCKYIHKNTGNRKYAWKDAGKKFNPSILFNNEISVKIDSEKYRQLEKLMFKLRMKEQLMVKSINKAVKEVSRSEGYQEKDSKYEIFYRICENMIVSIFDSREEAAEYLLDMEYLQRENEHKGKNILWNCFGDLIYKNICNNLSLADVPQRRKHYEISGSAYKTIEKRAVKLLNGVSGNSVCIYKEELAWLGSLAYKRNCKEDREILYILLVLSKQHHGKLRIYVNKKNQLTCSTIDKWIGEGACVCRKGLKRLKSMGVISINSVGRKYYDVEVKVPKFETQEKAFEVRQKNPLISFYKNNGERKIESCVICGKEFIKIGNAITCSSSCSSENRKRNNKKYSA